MTVNLQNTRFLRSAVRREDFPRDRLPQIVFAGRSNVGKSSVINRLLNRKNFARVGAEPGKTAHINFFCADDALYLVDLPGYGYAKVSKAERDRWGKLIEGYFAHADDMALGVVIVDARHAPTADDRAMAEWFEKSGRPWLAVANKIDKLNKSQLAPNLTLIRDTLNLPESVKLIPFSAEKGDGRQELLGEILARAAR